MSRRLYFFLVLLHIYFEAIALAILIVTQYPKELYPFEGDTANISCNWTIGSEEQIRVKWTKYQNESKRKETSLIWNINNTVTPTESNNNSTTYSVTHNKARMTISPVTEKDDGLYVCEVIIEKPMYDNGKGNGTLLKVQKNGGHTDFVPLGIICVFPVLVLVGYFLCKRRTTGHNTIIQNRGEEEEVSLNQVNGDNIDVEGDSNSSTHSVQWAVSIVYESVDYFAMKNPEDNATTFSADNLVESKTMDGSCLNSV